MRPSPVRLAAGIASCAVLIHLGGCAAGLPVTRIPVMRGGPPYPEGT